MTAPTEPGRPPGSVPADGSAAAAEPAAVARFRSRAAAAGLDVEVRTFPAGTRTAQEAAAAIGCDVAHIVKSLVFVAVDHRGDERPVLVLASGANRVDTHAVAAHLGVARLRKADADEVRAATGYAIGGTPPLGHDRDLTVLADRTLTDHPQVWAAAGTPTTVFGIDPTVLVTAAAAQIVDVAG